MRCRLCDLPHKNTSRHRLWLEFRVCRICAYFLEVFGWNTNYLEQYWREFQ